MLFTQAQFPGGGAGQGRGGQGRGGNIPSIGHFYGKLVDSKTNHPLDAASVQLILSKYDPATNTRKDTVVAGMLTSKNGQFSLENLPLFGQYRLQLSAIGYKAIDQKVAFDLKRPAGGDAGAGTGTGDNNGGGRDMSAALAGVDKDLGNIKMEADPQLLAGVTVTASKPLFQMGVDRKVFNVEKSLVSTGQTAQEIMKNIPSVNVDIDGNVTLRNAAPTIFVDGRPTTLTLDQIPADAIESVEIITNPSAKFDASGGTAGILNIVLKKNRKAGYNGNLRAGIDSRGKFNGGGDINIKQGKVNFFANANYNQRKSIATSDNLRHNFSPAVDIAQDDKNTNNGEFAFGRAGLDYLMDNRNTLTISGVAVRGKFHTIDDLKYDSTNTGGSLFTRGNQVSDVNAIFRNFGGALGYKHNFAKAGKELTADLNYNQSHNDNNSTFYTYYYNPDYSSKYTPVKRATEGNGRNKFFTGQLDYTDPITENMKVEAGARVAIRDNTSITNNYLYDNINSTNRTLFSAFSNNYEFQDRVYAGYVTFSNKIKTFSYQLGLRAESSDYTGTSFFKTGDSTFKTKYPISLFPSVFLTKDLGNRQDMQLNYSRRINRPNFFQLIPYTDITDPQNYSKGNPALQPEFTNSFELSYQKTFAKNYSLLVTSYFKYTTNLITRYTYYDKISSGGSLGDSAYFTTYKNANSSIAYGLEITGRTPFTSWWDMTTNVNLFNSKINADNIDNVPTNSIVSYFIKWNNSFKLPANFSIQLTGDYQSKSVLPQSSSNGGGGGGGGGGRGGGGGGMFGGAPQPSAQGYINPSYGLDLAIRKDFLKNKAASVTLSVNDIFRTRKYSYFSEALTFNQTYERRRDPQILRLNLAYRFGKMDVSLFKR
ncbi:MAG: TonB-dependent receptor, partial [Bacteroidetes bacterium]|nr:TonB-dependent receptor [Bacteroidota bacterium]